MNKGNLTLLSSICTFSLMSIALIRLIPAQNTLRILPFSFDQSIQYYYDSTLTIRDCGSIYNSSRVAHLLLLNNSTFQTFDQINLQTVSDSTSIAIQLDDMLSWQHVVKVYEFLKLKEKVISYLINEENSTIYIVAYDPRINYVYTNPDL